VTAAAASRPVIQSNVKGAGLILIASAFIAGSTLCAKQLGVGADALSPFQVTWGRFFFALPVLLVAALVLRPRFSSPQWGWHAVRVTCGVSGVTAMFYAATLIPLADTTAISFLNPMFAMVLAIVILGEKIGPIRWSMAALALIGAMLLIRPGTAGFQPAALIALFAAVVFGMEVVVLKLLARTESPFQIILIANIVGAVVASAVAPLVWQAPTPMQWVLLAATAVLMVTAQAFFTNALRVGEASFVLPFSYATLLFAAFYDFALFSVVPVPLSLLGGLIIIVSGIVLALRDGRAARKA